jgi:RimJ/RimL family protein N-acetyltransferase
MAHPYWPLFDIEVRTPLITLRAVTDEVAIELAALAARGIHDPAFAPFYTPWTDVESPELERGVLRFHWRSRADTTPTNWRIPFAAVVDDRIVGSTDLAASDFPTLRQFETGSWLGREFQGNGLGTEMRVATLTFGFLALDAEFATTGAWHDNGPSLGVTRSLGYEPEGSRRALRRNQADLLLGFRMTREHFLATIRRDDIEIDGISGTRELLALDTAD